MRGAWRNRSDKSAGFAVLAILALFVQLAVPQGFMVARQGDAAGLVICTGHGAWVAPADDHGAPAKSPKPKPDTTCAFAGHGGAPTIAQIASPASIRFETAALQGIVPASLTPGRGLAAPPPPSQGPPIHIL